MLSVMSALLIISFKPSMVMGLPLGRMSRTGPQSGRAPVYVDSLSINARRADSSSDMAFTEKGRRAARVGA